MERRKGNKSHMGMCQITREIGDMRDARIASVIK